MHKTRDGGNELEIRVDLRLPPPLVPPRRLQVLLACCIYLCLPWQLILSVF